MAPLSAAGARIEVVLFIFSNVLFIPSISFEQPVMMKIPAIAVAIKVAKITFFVLILLIIS
jgi:hypothetical protein